MTQWFRRRLVYPDFFFSACEGGGNERGGWISSSCFFAEVMVSYGDRLVGDTLIQYERVMQLKARASWSVVCTKGTSTHHRSFSFVKSQVLLFVNSFSTETGFGKARVLTSSVTD